MHKLMKYICDELEELERKADKEGKLSLAEIQYADTLAHMKKNLLKSEEMMEDSEYSENEGNSYRASYGRGSSRRGGRSNEGGSSYRSNGGGSYEGGSSYEGGGSYEGGSSMARGRGRNARRDSMGRYSRGGETEMMVQELRELMENAPDENTRMEFQRFIQKIEQM